MRLNNIWYVLSPIKINIGWIFFPENIASFYVNVFYLYGFLLNHPDACADYNEHNGCSTCVLHAEFQELDGYLAIKVTR
jgi:hypothetical protein